MTAEQIEDKIMTLANKADNKIKAALINFMDEADDVDGSTHPQIVGFVISILTAELASICVNYFTRDDFIELVGHAYNNAKQEEKDAA